MRPAIANEYEVLRVLAPGNVFTVTELATRAELTGRQTRNAVLSLRAKGLVIAERGARWAVTPRGRGLWAVQGRRFIW